METPISNTLFRFISLRSPQLIDPLRSSVLFLELPKTLEKGVFYEAILTKPVKQTKLEALIKASEKYKEVILENTELMQRFPSMYNFSVWLAQNKSTATEKEIQMMIEKIVPLKELDLQQLWNNVFYHSLQQKNLRLKDDLIELLLANHLVFKSKNMGTTDPKRSLKDLALTQLVLPPLLFDETRWESKVDEGPPPDKVTLYSRALNAKKETSLALRKTQQYNELKEELKILENEYIAGFQQTYSSSIYEYQLNLLPQLKEYYRTISKIRREYLLNRPIEYSSNVSILDFIYDEVEYPYIPDFEFDYPDPLSDYILKRSLSTRNYQLLLEVAGISPQTQSTTTSRNPQATLNAIGSFAQLRSLLDRAQNQEEVQLAKNSRGLQPVSSIGGVLFPVDQSFSKVPFQYAVIPTELHQFYTATISITVPDSTWELSHIKMTTSVNSSRVETQELTRPVLEHQGNEITIYNVGGFSRNTATDAYRISLDLLFNNGQTLGIPFVEITKSTNFTGMLSGIPTVDFALRSRNTIPNAYGVKMLGIADYKKVEQTIHCYVEGEVSHIENIMAREYREKATRKLQRSDITTAQSEEMESEQLSDTATTDRFEMQLEIDKIIRESKNTSGFVNFGFKNSQFYVDGGMAQAHNTSKEDSIRRSVTEAKEVTEQALDRVVKKIKSERITKIVDEFEENNLHGFDNRKGDQHVVGVYRWVDKLYKNQLYNYGKRMLFEFMIPEPGRLHNLALLSDTAPSTNTTLHKPLDPRSDGGLMSVSHAGYMTETKAQFWAAQYNVELSVLKDEVIYISAAFADRGSSQNYIEKNNYTGGNNFSIELPEDYQAKFYQGRFNFAFVPKKIEDVTGGIVTIGKNDHAVLKQIHTSQYISNFLPGIEKKLEIAFTGIDVGGMSITLEVRCELKGDAKKQWQQEAFNNILTAYFDALDRYNNALAIEASKAVEIKRTNPGFYREIENTVLRKNCISYLVSESEMGKKFTHGDQFDSFSIPQNTALDRYSSLIKFLEQAFEWSLMSYHFYPYYWADKNRWKTMYNYNESDDPIFRDFMQSGMARVMVTVRPGFEEAVQLYMSTGKLWSGGQIPIVGTPLYVSIIDEVRRVKTEKEGKAWISRVPTTLTILQAQSIGLAVEKALPCHCENTADFEDPTQVPCSDNFTLKDNKMQGSGADS